METLPSFKEWTTPALETLASSFRWATRAREESDFLLEADDSGLGVDDLPFAEPSFVHVEKSCAKIEDDFVCFDVDSIFEGREIGMQMGLFLAGC